MSGVKISALTAASALSGSDSFPIDQGDTTVRATMDQVKTFAGGGSSGPAVYFGAGAPTTLHDDGDLYFDTSATPYNGYVQNTVTTGGASPALLQHASGYTNSGTASPTLPAAPTPGNLILCWILEPGNGNLNPAEGWTDAGLTCGGGSAGTVCHLNYRYAVAGDGAVLPDVSNTGSLATWVTAEIAGAASTWAAALTASHGDSGATTAQLASSAAGELAVLVWQSSLELFSGSASTISGAGWSQDEVGPTAFNSFGLAHASLSDAGSETSAATVSPTNLYLEVLLKGSASVGHDWVRFS